MFCFWIRISSLTIVLLRIVFQFVSGTALRRLLFRRFLLVLIFGVHVLRFGRIVWLGLGGVEGVSRGSIERARWLSLGLLRIGCGFGRIQSFISGLSKRGLKRLGVKVK